MMGFSTNYEGQEMRFILDGKEISTFNLAFVADIPKEGDKILMDEKFYLVTDKIYIFDNPKQILIYIKEVVAPSRLWYKTNGLPNQLTRL